MPKDVYDALYYYNEDGEEGYDMSEVLILEDKSDTNRIKKLIEILNCDNKYYAYQATQILVAWNYQEGYDKLIQIINDRWDKYEKFSPHRIFNDETMYEEFSYCIRLSTYNGNSEANKLELSKRLLKLFVEEQLYLKLNFTQLLLSLHSVEELVDELEYSISILLVDQPSKASVLLPVLTKIDSKYFDKYISSFEYLAGEDRWIEAHIAEAREILKTKL